MMRHSIESKDWIFVKGYRFLSFAKKIVKNIGKNLNDKYVQKLFHHVKQSATDALVIWLAVKFLIELQMSQEVHHRIVQRQLQMSMIKNYLKKDIYIYIYRISKNNKLVRQYTKSTI